jgi:molybdenum cofactor cytidylyltransferase
MKITGLILSAGLSERMNSFKPVLIFQNEPLIVLVIKKLLNICDDVIVVTGYKKEIIERTIEERFKEMPERIKTIYNQTYREGMFSSLKKGLSETSDSDWIIYHFVDQPSLPENYYYDFIEQIDDKYNWIQPSYNVKKGHPIILHRSIFNLILNGGSNSSLKEISRDESVIKKIWNCNYPQIHQDLDTPQDFNNISQQIFKGS